MLRWIQPIVFITVLFCSHTLWPQYASFINKFENPALGIKKRLVVSLKQAMRSEYQNRVWIAYCIDVQKNRMTPMMYQTSLPTLRELLSSPNDAVSSRPKGKAAKLLTPEWSHNRLKLERSSDDKMAILLDFSIESGRPILLRAQSIPMNSPFRLGYQELYWLGNVSHDESISLLSDCFKEYTYIQLRKSLLSLLDLHDDTQRIVGIYQRILGDDYSDDLKEACIFMLGQNRTAQSELVLSKYIIENKNSELRRKAIMALSHAKTKPAFDVLSHVFKHEKDVQIRKDAMLSLGMMANEKSLPLLTTILLNDKNSEMREFSVFVMGQIAHPKAETILTQIGRTHPDMAIRQKALNWLQRNNNQRAHQTSYPLFDDSD
ncbi:HEAT repeat domain-containing protein [candidate division KSB1 bacterium]|nr:HEAT repeat domain-containing protein [candidate division KSB1 bacterium]